MISFRQPMSDEKLDQLFEFLRFASVSTDSAYAEDVANCAGWLCNKLQSIGLDAEVHQTLGHPVVTGRTKHDPSKKTVLIYGHYDVQPVDPLELWRTPPFEPDLTDGVITARGATDNKGQIFAHICGVELALKENGELPVNLIFLIEGEEEVGSDHLESFLEENKENLACDIVAVSDTGMLDRGVPTFTYGLRGISALEFTVRGPDRDLHSGIFGGTVENPATVVARILASLHDANGKVAIDGFYDDVQPMLDWEREAWAKLPHNDEKLKELTGVPALAGESGFSGIERLWARPTAEVNGIGGGYQGEGTKTVLPKEAMAKLTFRLVPAQDPQKILEAAVAHIKKHCPPSVTIEIETGHSGKAYLVDPNSKYGKAAQSALQKTFGGEPALIREGGSIPIVQTFKDVLDVDTLLLGLALPDCNAHSPNENFPVENFYYGIELNQKLLAEIASAS